MAFSTKGLTHRSTVMGTRGMVATALNVVEPYMSGIAGVGYMQIYSIKT